MVNIWGIYYIVVFDNFSDSSRIFRISSKLGLWSLFCLTHFLNKSIINSGVSGRKSLTSFLKAFWVSLLSLSSSKFHSSGVLSNSFNFESKIISFNIQLNLKTNKLLLHLEYQQMDSCLRTFHIKPFQMNKPLLCW